MDCDCCGRNGFAGNTFEPNVCRTCAHDEREHYRTPGYASAPAMSRSDVSVGSQVNTVTGNQPAPQPRPRPRQRVPQPQSGDSGVVQANNKAMELRSRLEDKFKTSRVSPVDGAQIARDIMALNVSVRCRYSALDLTDIIERNKPKEDLGSNDYLTMLSSAFDILEKYAVNLLKTNRPQYWRQIKYSNGVFQARVDCMSGARNILKQMGYSQEKDQGLSFPESAVEPDIEQVSRVATDLLLARIEVDAFHEGTHPHPESLKNIASQVEMSLPLNLAQRPSQVPQREFQSHVDMPQQFGVGNRPTQSGYMQSSQVQPSPTDARGVPASSHYRPVPAPRVRTPSLPTAKQVTGQPLQHQTQPVLPETGFAQQSHQISYPPSNDRPVGVPSIQQQQRQMGDIHLPPHNEQLPSLDMYASIAPQTPSTSSAIKPIQPADQQTYTLTEKICPSCQTVCASKAKFCRGCRFQFPETPARAAPTMKYCSCGEELDLGVKFCEQCGSDVDPQLSLAEQSSFAQGSKAMPKQHQQPNPPVEARVPEVVKSKQVIQQQCPPVEVARPAPPVSAEPVALAGQWNCEFCTYLNNASRKICEMCSKTQTNVLAEMKPRPRSPQQTLPTTAEAQPAPLQQQQQQQQHVSHVATVQPQQQQYPRIYHQASDRRDMKLNFADPQGAAAVGGSDSSVSAYRSEAAQMNKMDEIVNKGQQKEQYRKEQEAKAARDLTEKNKLDTMDDMNTVQSVLVSDKYGKDLSDGRSASSRSQRQPATFEDGHRYSGQHMSGIQGGDGPPLVDDSKHGMSETVRRVHALSESSDDPRSGFAATPGDRMHPSSSGEHSRRAYAEELERQQRELEEERRREQQLEEERRRQVEAARRELDSIRQRDRQFFIFLKEAEKINFDPEEVEIAMKAVGDENDPISWLINQLPGKLTTVAQLAATHGRSQYGHLGGLGAFAPQEARKYYVKNRGNLDDTVKAMCEARMKQIAEVKQWGEFDHADVCRSLMETNGDVGRAVAFIQAARLQPFVDHIWQEEELSSEDESQADGLRSKKRVPKTVKELVVKKDIDCDRRTRILFAEYEMTSWGRAQIAVRLLEERAENTAYSLSNIIEAAEANQEFARAKNYLEQECPICTEFYSRSQMLTMPSCQHSICKDCVSQHFSVMITEKSVTKFTCPICEEPRMEDKERTAFHFQALSAMLRPVLERDHYELLHRKLTERTLMEDPNFRWCSHCQYGFINENVLRLKMTCPQCNKDSCFQCKKKWEPQHDGITCEAFHQWQLDNDPDNQLRGVAAQLDQDGIDCPHCHFQYALSKGGCMHFKCTQCSHEFCSGCSIPFLKNCTKFENCGGGLHAHHPRDCLYYMRDNSVETLRALLNSRDIPFDTEPPNGGKGDGDEDGPVAAARPDELKCTVKEQKETPDRLVDEPCGRDSGEGFAGLCEKHYKEYLVQLINVNNVDPVDILDQDEIKTVLMRERKQMPPKLGTETDPDYLERLRQHVRDEIPLENRNQRGVLEWQN